MFLSKFFWIFDSVCPCPLCLCDYAFVFVSVFVSVSLSVCVFVALSVSMCVCVSVSVPMSVSLSVSVSVSVSASVSVSVSVTVCVCAYIFFCVYDCDYVFVSLWVGACVRVCQNFHYLFWCLCVYYVSVFVYAWLWVQVHALFSHLVYSGVQFLPFQVQAFFVKLICGHQKQVKRNLQIWEKWPSQVEIRPSQNIPVSLSLSLFLSLPPFFSRYCATHLKGPFNRNCAHVHLKRQLYVHDKTPIYISKGTHIQVKWVLYTCEKRPTYMWDHFLTTVRMSSRSAMMFEIAARIYWSSSTTSCLCQQRSTRMIHHLTCTNLHENW